MATRAVGPSVGSPARAPLRTPPRPVRPTPAGLNLLAAELVGLQRSAGNSAVQQLLLAGTVGQHVARPADAAAAAAAVQRAAAGMPDKLSDDINRVLDDTPAGAARTDAKMLAQILKHIREDPANERPTARRDPRIVRRLPTDLSRTSALTVLRALEATLAERLPTATGAPGAPAASLRIILNEISAAPANQRRAVLSEPALLAGIEGAIPRADSLTALAALGAALREVLNAGMRGAGAESAAMLRAAAAAPGGQKTEVLADGATVALLAARLSRTDNLRMLASLKAPFVDQLNATVAAGSGAADGAAAIRLAAAARPAERELATADRDLIGRLRTALSPAQMRDVLVGLRAALADLLTLLIGTAAGTEAELVRVIGAASATDRQAALDDAGTVGNIMGAFAVPAAAWHVRAALAFGSQARIDASSAQVPALSNGAAYRADAHLTAGQQNDAFTVITDALTARRRVDASTITGITFVAALAEDAKVTFPGFAQDATTHKYAPTGKPKIEVGPAALSSVSVAVSAILRESARAVRESKPSAADPTSADAQALQTTESLLYEIEHRRDSGVGRYGARMHDLGTRLTAVYATLSAASQKRLKTRHDRAQAAVAAVPIGAAPTAAAASLTATISAELAKAPVGTAAIIAAITAADDTHRRPVGANHDLVRRITAAMTRTDALSVLNLLHAPLTQRVEFLLTVGAPTAELVATITGASAADKQTLQQNRALFDRVVATVGDAQVAPVMAALGGSLGDEISRALGAAGPAAAVASAIAAATPANREVVERNQALLDRIGTALGFFELWRVQLLLRFGSAAGLPTAATKLLAGLAGGPAIGPVRTLFRTLTDAELGAARTLPGIRPMLMQLLTADADQRIVLRMLDLGMLDEETGMGAAWSETLQVANGAGVFVPTVFPATSGFDLEYQRTGLICTVRINVTGAGAAVTRNLPRSKQIWQSNIESAWNRKYKVTNANHDIPLIFNVNFTGTGAHHNVTAHAGVPVWPGLNMLNWFVDDPSTGRGNRAYVNNAAIHEFGHMIGNPDEYQLSQAHYLATVGTNPTTDPNATATADTAGTQSYTNTNSVMGGHLPGTNLPGPVQQRHVTFMLTWINAHRNPAEPVFTLANA